MHTSFENSEFYNLQDVLELSIQKKFKWHETYILQLSHAVLKALQQKQNLTETSFFLPSQIEIFKTGEVQFKESKSEVSNFENLRFVPPEVHQGISAQDERHLIYALGVLLFELAAGEKVFNADTPEEIQVKISNEDFDESTLISKGYSLSLIEFIFSMIEKNIQKRVQKINLAFEAVDDNLIKKQFISETLLWDEYLRLLSFENKFEKATSTTNLKTKQKRKFRIPSYLRVKIALISLGCIFFCISVFLFSKDQDDLQLFYELGNDKIEVRGPNSSSQGLAKLSPKACELVAKGLQTQTQAVLKSDQLNSMNFDFSIQKFYQMSLEITKTLQSKLDYFSEACADSINVKNTVKEYLQFYQTLQDSNPQTFVDIKQWSDSLTQKVKISPLQEPVETRGTQELEEKLEQIQFFESHLRIGFDTLNLANSRMPRTVQECQEIMDLFWVEKQILSSQSHGLFQKFDVLLLPSDYELKLEKTGWNRIRMQSEYFKKSEKFQSKVCVYRREKGILKEISLRDIQK